MRNHKVFAGVIILLTSLLWSGVHAQQAVSAKPQPAPPAAMPAMPFEIIYESSVGQVNFPHQAHMKFGCKQCHHQIQAAPLDTPHPDYLASSWVNCQDCHDPGPGKNSNNYKCSECHHSEPENISDETLSSKVVVHQSCWKCHQTGTGAKASKGCTDCHVKKQEQPQ